MAAALALLTPRGAGALRLLRRAARYPPTGYFILVAALQGWHGRWHRAARWCARARDAGECVPVLDFSSAADRRRLERVLRDHAAEPVTRAAGVPALAAALRGSPACRQELLHMVREVECGRCRVQGRRLRLCAGGCGTRYCSRRCQKEAWARGHREACSRVAL